MNFHFHIPQLQIPGTAPAVPADSVPTPGQELELLRDLPVDELLARLVNGLVSLAINLAVAAVVFYLGRFIIRRIHAVVAAIFRRRNVDPSICTFVLSVLRLVLYFILIVTVIGILGIETSSFLAIFASAGVALGMALSGTLQNFAGGVLILLLKPYRVGDYIEAMGYGGTVREIQIFSTIICTPDNKSIIIPNGGLSTASINNWSRMAYRRLEWIVSISYGNDVELARSLILEVLQGDSAIVDHADDAPVVSPPSVVLKELGASSVDLKVTAWTRTASYWEVFYRVNERIYTRLGASPITFPYPQLDVHLSK